MSRDQKPGRSNPVVIAPARAPETGAIGTAEAPVLAPSATKQPILLLAGVFVISSTLGGIGVALAERLLP